jgi:hypothetical protein
VIDVRDDIGKGEAPADFGDDDFQQLTRADAQGNLGLVIGNPLAGRERTPDVPT